MIWTVEGVLKDPYGICDSFTEYLKSKHLKKSWNIFADHLLEKLKTDHGSKDHNDFHTRFHRDRVSDWAIHALEHAGREKEIIPLCESEAEKTHSYDRLTERLISAKLYDEAENWIRKGLGTIGPRWQGISSSLRSQYRSILVKKKKRFELTAFDVEDFIRDPSKECYKNVRKTAKIINLWDRIRIYLLQYLEDGTLPWDHKKWPLPESGLGKPLRSKHREFPMIDTLIQIAILEKNPDQVLHWFDKRPKNRLWGHDINDDSIAKAVQNHAPEKAVEIWKKKAERIIAQVKPNLYRDAVKYLQKAEKLMLKENKKKEWDHYMKQLRQAHARKTRLMEILDGRDKKPIMRRRRR